MTELVLVPPIAEAAPESGPAARARSLSAGERLGFECALLAGRLAAFLRRALPPEEGPHTAGLEFLERSFAAARAAADSGGLLFAGGRPFDETEGPLDRRPPGGPDPLDRLAGGLGLSAFEVDLLLLAGLAEEHEGYADVFRVLHPQGKAQPTLGLAAQLFAGDEAGRRALRAVVEAGPARRSGLLALDGDGPFFGRSVGLAEALWSALQGIDAWPARLGLGSPSGSPPEPIDPFAGAARFGLESWLESPAAAHAAAALRQGDAVTILIAAGDPEVAYERAAALAAAAGVRAIGFRLPAALPDAELERSIGLHALARGAVPVLRLPDGDGGPGPVPVPGFPDHPAPIVVCARAGAAEIRGHRPVVA